MTTLPGAATPGSQFAQRRSPGLPLSSRFALRELRGGLRGFYIFLACIVLGTGTIAAVGSLAAGLTGSIAREGQALLGGDIAFSLVHREASGPERTFLETAGRFTEGATLRAIVRTSGGKQALVELKGVDRAYPLYGALVLRSGRTAQEALRVRAPLEPGTGNAGGGDDGVVPAAVDESLLATAQLKLGDEVGIGRLRVRIADVIEREPDKLSGGIAFGPRVMVPVSALERSGLIGPGSLVRWHYRIAGAAGPMSEAQIETLAQTAKTQFPSAGWRVETRNDAAPRLRESIDRFAQFLTLVGLTSLAVGGVGVANAVRAYLGQKRRSIATLRALGASSGFVVRVYLQQILILAFFGVVVGLCLGAAAAPAAGVLLDGILPVSGLFALFPGALGLAFLYGTLTALAFAMWPLGQAQGVRAIALLRDDAASGPASGQVAFALATAAVGLVLVVTAVAGAYDRWLAGIFVVGITAIFVVLRAVAALITVIARRLPRSGSTIVRMAVANLHRRGSLTVTVTISLGLSLTLLATLSLVDGNLRNTLTSRLPAEAPSFFFIDIQDAERVAFLRELQALAPDGEIEMQPMLRGRIVSINGILAEDWPESEASWVLRGDRGITYADSVPDGSKVVDGQWWPATGTSRNEVSFAADLAKELGVKPGDVIRVNVLGREVEATVTNLRTVEWESLSINFVMVFSPNVFEGAPHAHLATLSFPDEDGKARELAVLKGISEAFPTVTSVRVKDALDAVNNVVSDLVLAVRAAASVTLIASVLVLAGTLAASHRSRIYDAVILKTLGARRRVVMGAYALEYALLGICCAVFALMAGTVAAWYIIVDLMKLEFDFLPLTAIMTVLIAVAVTVGLGLIGTWRALGVKPAQVLRAF